MRINKFLSQAGLGSRRKVEELIINGYIKVNGKIEKNLSTDITKNDTVTYFNRKIKIKENFEYYMLHKPKGYVTTENDEFGRKTVMNLVSNIKTRVFPVGRLDYETEGLLLFTNDGNLANKIMKPNFAIDKTYICNIKGMISEDEIKTLEDGIILDGKKLNKCTISVKSFDENKTRLEITINQGINRQIRRMMEYINKDVISLKRIKIGELTLGGLTRGTYRELHKNEISYLKDLCKI